MCVCVFDGRVLFIQREAAQVLHTLGKLTYALKTGARWYSPAKWIFS